MKRNRVQKPRARIASQEAAIQPQVLTMSSTQQLARRWKGHEVEVVGGVTALVVVPEAVGEGEVGDDEVEPVVDAARFADPTNREKDLVQMKCPDLEVRLTSGPSEP